MDAKQEFDKVFSAGWPGQFTPTVYPASLFRALNLGAHTVKHSQSGRVFAPVENTMQANHYVAIYQDDVGNRYTVTVEAVK